MKSDKNFNVDKALSIFDPHPDIASHWNTGRSGVRVDFKPTEPAPRETLRRAMVTIDTQAVDHYDAKQLSEFFLKLSNKLSGE